MFRTCLYMRASHTVTAKRSNLLIWSLASAVMLSGAPSTLVALSTSAVPQPQLEQRSSPDSTRIRSQVEDAQARFETDPRPAPALRLGWG